MKTAITGKVAHLFSAYQVPTTSEGLGLSPALAEKVTTDVRHRFVWSKNGFSKDLPIVLVNGYRDISRVLARRHQGNWFLAIKKGPSLAMARWLYTGLARQLSEADCIGVITNILPGAFRQALTTERIMVFLLADGQLMPSIRHDSQVHLQSALDKVLPTDRTMFTGHGLIPLGIKIGNSFQYVRVRYRVTVDEIAHFTGKPLTDDGKQSDQ